MPNDLDLCLSFDRVGTAGIQGKSWRGLLSDFPVLPCFESAAAALTPKFRYSQSAVVMAVVAHHQEAFGLGRGAIRAVHFDDSHSPREQRRVSSDECPLVIAWTAWICLHSTCLYLWSGQSHTQSRPARVTAYPERPVWDRTKNESGLICSMSSGAILSPRCFLVNICVAIYIYLHKL